MNRLEKFLKRNDFLFFTENYLKQHSYKYAAETLRSYKAHLSVLREFSPKIRFKDITPDFIAEYYNYVVDVRELQESSAHKKIAVLRTFTNNAKRAGKIKKNPFDEIKIKEFKGNRDFLTLEELKQVENHYQKSQNKYLRWFLFSCYTGLRFLDLKNLKKRDIINNIIQIKQNKTSEYVRIPLCKKALRLIQEENNEGKKVFKINSNQVVNRNIKKEIQKIKIEKYITFHVSRHTFATSQITIGTPVEVVSKLLGHTNIKTTMIYVNIVDNLRIKAIEKFDEVYNVA